MVTNKASMVRTLVRDCKVELAQACKLVGVHYSQGLSALKLVGHKAPKSEVARMLKKQGAPISAVASALKMTYSHAHRA